MKAMTFEEVFDLAACPYCKAAKGVPCSDKRRKPYNGKPDDSPHLSRVKAARVARSVTS
jgi:hypothetical protein